MTSQTGMSLADHLRNSPLSDLRAYMATRIITISDEFEGVAGTSLNVLVEPEMWQLIVATPKYHYDYSMLGLYGELDLHMRSWLTSANAMWAFNEALGSTMVKMGKDRGDDISLEDALTIWRFGIGFSAAAENSSYFSAPDRDYQLASVLDVYNWWLPTTESSWVQLTMLPDGDLASLSDETLELAIRVTRHGWSVSGTYILASELAEIRRHMAGPMEVIGIE